MQFYAHENANKVFLSEIILLPALFSKTSKFQHKLTLSFRHSILIFICQTIQRIIRQTNNIVLERTISFSFDTGLCNLIALLPNTRSKFNFQRFYLLFAEIQSERIKATVRAEEWEGKTPGREWERKWWKRHRNSKRERAASKKRKNVVKSIWKQWIIRRDFRFLRAVSLCQRSYERCAWPKRERENEPNHYVWVSMRFKYPAIVER